MSPTHRAFHAFDALLATSDVESFDWCDGAGAETALSLLAAFSPADWLALQAAHSSRGKAWRSCLASILRPCAQHAAAQRLMFDLAGDPDDEIAFMAVSGISHHCGVILGAQGACIDPAVRVPWFLAAARVEPDLRQRIERASVDCDPVFRARFELLLQELAGDAEPVQKP